MSIADKLLKRAESFEKLAVYSDRRTFLRSLSQDIPGYPSGPYDTKNQSTLPEEPSFPQSKVPQSQLDEIKSKPPEIANTIKNTVYPAYKANSASNVDEVNEVASLLNQGQALLSAGKPWLKIDQYNDVSSKLKEIIMKLNAKKLALETEPKIGAEGLKIVDSLKDIRNASEKASAMHSKLFAVYNRLNPKGLKEKFV
jgi:hypothetical protein